MHAQQLGGLVRRLTLVLEDDLMGNHHLPIHELLSSMPNIQSLTIIHALEDIGKRTPLQCAVEKFVHLEEVTLREKDYELGHSYILPPMVATFFHTFLYSILKVHSGRLKALHLYTCLSLGRQVYVDIRDKTPNLRSVTFNKSIGMDLEGLFAEHTPWASGQTGRLESLTLQECRGTHADRFVENILHGVYGVQLKEVQFIRSGRYSVQIPDPPSTPVFGSIEYLCFDQINTQELSTIALIPIQELSLTCITNDAFCRLPSLLQGDSSGSGGAQLAFKGLKRLRLSSRFAPETVWKKLPAECKAAYQDLRENSLPQRGIQLTLDAPDWPFACNCSDHE
jgi:hypothetical protein